MVLFISMRACRQGLHSNMGPFYKAENRRRRVSFFIRLVLALVMMALVVFASYEHFWSEKGEGTRRTSSKPFRGKQMVESLKFTGEDKKNNPYAVIAERGVNESASTVKLDNVKSRFIMGDGSQIFVLAKEGSLNFDKEKRADLKGGVSFIRDNKCEFMTDKATINFKENILKSDDAVEGQSDFGHVIAEGFSYDANKKALCFKGKTVITDEKI